MRISLFGFDSRFPEVSGDVSAERSAIGKRRLLTKLAADQGRALMLGCLSQIRESPTGLRPLYRLAAIIRLLPRLLLFSLAGSVCSPAAAAELSDCREMLRTGRYEECIAAAAEAFARRRYGESWPVLQTEAEMALGRYEEALRTVERGVERYSWSIRLRWLGREAALRNGQPELAETRLTEIRELVKKFSWRYTDAEELVVLGRIDRLDGKDARDVLSNRYEKARDRNSYTRGPWLAIGELALEKDDAAFAAEVFSKALQQFEGDPDLHFGMSQAVGSSDPQAAMRHLAAALEANPKHIPSLLFQVERLMQSESYEQADQLLQRVFDVNPLWPEAWAYRSVIAHLTNDPRGEIAYRDAALSRWKNNPRVDHLIGRLLSQHYRFSEGAAAQYRALLIDPDFTPAKRQLAQDLLRLGNESDGWELAHAAYDQDPYNVSTFNLLELHDELNQFVTLEDDFFILRMERREAALYGDEALALLNRARQTLCTRYGLALNGRIVVEIFPDEDDFAVRTFGMPAVQGFLGVCFGRVITANSPASRRDNPSNWQSVLWHEFCHVVTLELTGNRIPRWLSEGISVYEELQADPRWGQRMTPRYRQHILDGGHTPLPELSSAFMNPESGWHLQFAYFESSLAVAFLIETFGTDALLKVLHDLRAGLPVNAALDRRCADIRKLEADFDKWIRQQAASLAPGVDWSPLLADASSPASVPANSGNPAAPQDSTDETGESTDLPDESAEPPLNEPAKAPADGTEPDAETADPSDGLLDENGRLNWQRLEAWLNDHPNHFAGLMLLADAQLSQQNWSAAEVTLKQLVSIYPQYNASDNAYEKLATVYRQLGRTNDERAALEAFVEQSADGMAANLRLVELQTSASDWRAVQETARRLLAVDPLLPQVHAAAAIAAERLQQPARAAVALRRLALLEPDDPADVHQRLAAALYETGQHDAARRHVLKALEEAPRYRAAHQLLLRIVRGTSRGKTGSAAEPVQAVPGGSGGGTIDSASVPPAAP